MNAIYKGLILNPKNNNKLEVFSPGYLVVSSKGIIEELSKKDPRQHYKNYQFIDYSNYLICPGFIDIHNHLPQYAFAGIGEKDLLPWLKKYTFPREATFSKDKIARQSAKIFFHDLLKNGTTTTSTFVTIHKKATDIAFQEAGKTGLRAIIGKVMMDQNSPRALKEKPADSLRESLELIEKWHGRNNKLFYALTPRFAISCSNELMKKIGKIASAKNVYIQTHLAENNQEIAFVKKLFPATRNYTDIYHRAGLLGPKTIMAHCVHLSAPEIKLLKKTNTKIAHCPTSNNFLLSGIMPYRKYARAGLNIGLGTDVAGGYSLSMLNEMKEAIENSKYAALFLNNNSANSKENSPPMTIAEAFYLATLGGAKALSMDNEIGSLEKGKKADFLVINYAASDPTPEKSLYRHPDQILSRLIYRGKAADIKHVYINGEKVTSERKDI